MPAFLTSTDFDGLIPDVTLLQVTTDTAAAVTIDETVIAACAQRAWDEMWGVLGNRYIEPSTCPAGECKGILLDLTTYRLYLRRPEVFRTNAYNDERSRDPIEALYNKAMKKLYAAISPGEIVLKGLTILDAEDSQSGAAFVSNERIYDDTNLRGF